MTHTEIVLAVQEISVGITEWALAAGTKESSAQRSDVENIPNNSMKRKVLFWGNSKKSEKSVAQKVTPPSRMSTYDQRSWQTYTAKYAVYSAGVMVKPSEDLHKGLKSMTKKDPPSHFEFEMVYVSLPNGVVINPALMIAVLQRAT